MDRSVLHQLSYGMYVITAADGARPTGCMANSVMQITSRPVPTVAVSLNQGCFTHACISRSGTFGVNILSEAASAELVENFGFSSGRDRDKFENVPYTWEAGVPVLSGDCGGMACKVVDKLVYGSHTIFLGEVVSSLPGQAGAEPMTYAWYRRSVKGQGG